MKYMKHGFLALLFSLPGLMLAAAPVTAGDELSEIRKSLAEAVPGGKPDSVRKSSVPGLYEAVYGTQVFYITRDGNFIIQGDIHDIRLGRNLSEQIRKKLRLKILQPFGKDEMIIFSPEKGTRRHTITVFTDIDCSYCRKLHNEIESYNFLGIEVRYLFFPRSGVGTPSYNKAVTVWCSKDRQDALTRAKFGEKLPGKDCVNPVHKHMRAGEALGITGTPTIVLSDGRKLPGYVPAQRLNNLLNNRKKR